MSETINAASVNTIMNLENTIEAPTLEKLIDLAINTLNLFGAGLSNLGGTPGTMFVTVTSAQAGAIYIAVRAIKYGFYDKMAAGAVAGLSISVTDLMSNPEVLRLIREAAQRLQQKKSGIPFVVATDDS